MSVARMKSAKFGQSNDSAECQLCVGSRRNLVVFKLISIAIATWLVSGAGVAQVRDGPETEWRKSVNGLGAALMITKNTEGFVREWTTTPESHRLTLETPRVIHVGESFGPLLFFWGCHPSGDSCRVYADFELVAPNGTVLHRAPDQRGTPQPKPKPELVYLSQAIVIFRIDAGDPLGQYQINATVREPSVGNVLRLSKQFMVIK